MSEAASTTVVVNKKHQLPSAYVPAGLVAYGAGQIKSEAAQALTKLFSAAQEQGFTLKLISGYRSYDSQKAVYIGYVNRDGQAAADTYSARPGFSEHQTGLAADIGSTSCDLDTCFGDTLVGQWVAANAQNYGFIIRYPKGKELETGYQYEPWHLRYLGVQTAQAVYTSGKTLDQYYNVPAGGYE
jgi:D-alanyl-D-alanine carboxypeptidase